MSPRRIILPVFVPHFGCPHDCVFCNQEKISGVSDKATADRVIEDIVKLTRNYNGPPAELAFYGGSFTAIPSEVREEILSAALPFLNAVAGNRIRVSTRPDCIDEAALDMLQKFKVDTVELGAQSFCDDVLLLSNRGHTSKDIIEASKLIERRGLGLILQMMTGLPGDTREKSIYTARQIVKIRPAGVRIYPTVVIRGTRLHEMLMRGEYAEHSLEDAVATGADVAEIFIKAGIPIIRLGLNPNEELSGGEAVAGAYHPALGELVYSRIMRKLAESALKGKGLRGEVVFVVNKRQVSFMAGQKRENTVYLREKFALDRIRILPSEDVPEWEIKLL